MQFLPFRRLPFELRRQIWQIAVENGNGGDEVCVLALKKRRGGGPHKNAPLLVRSSVFQSPLLQTCSEARTVALEMPPPERPYNPDSDILYISADTFRAFTGDICFKHPPAWVARIRHLALELRVACAGGWLPSSLRYMTALETLSIVFPQTHGTIDVHAPVEIPSNPRKQLGFRTLTKREFEKDLIINADYNYETEVGDLRIRWTKLAADFMVSKVIKQLAGDMDSTRPVPCWDAENKQFSLNFEARCFV